MFILKKKNKNITWKMELKELHENSLFSYNSKDSGLELECD